ncbi:MAG: hypothetical protein QM571_04390 [Micrococcaceae bacterium]
MDKIIKKRWLSIEQKIEKLKTCNLPDAEKFISEIETYGYYRIRSYAYPFRNENSKNMDSALKQIFHTT